MILLSAHCTDGTRCQPDTLRLPVQAAQQQRDSAVAQLLKVAALRPPHKDNPARTPEVCINAVCC